MSSSQNFESSPIGIIGLGDLGNRLVAQALSAQLEVLTFDPTVGGTDTNEIAKTCGMIHWAAPLASLEGLQEMPGNRTVVLHDSVMSSSVAALEQRTDASQFAVAHWLMNDAGRILISTEYGDHDTVTEHFEELGLHPRKTTVAEHDKLMARTQGIFALLIDSNIKEVLDAGFEAGDLTPSAAELREAITQREASWTDQTLRSILQNPELGSFIEELATISRR